MQINQNEDLVNQIEQNLLHYNLWSDVKKQYITSRECVISVVSGFPPEKLDARDSERQKEWVIPLSVILRDDLHVSVINSWFKGITNLTGQRPARLTLGLLHLDSTIVYYFVYDGIVRPRQN